MYRVALALSFAAFFTVACGTPGDGSPSTETPASGSSGEEAEAPAEEETEPPSEEPSAALCERAYDAMVAAIRAQEGAVGGRPVGLPDRDRFMAECPGLPAAMQRCLLDEYQTQHVDECNQVLADLPPETRATVHEIVAND